ncbi:MAG: hypothetical protein V9G19_27775 [Tetrasphaera sp.]
MRSAPVASFFRHAGSRKIVLAVDGPTLARGEHERELRVARGGVLVRQRRELVEQLGDREVDASVRRVDAAARVSSYGVDGEGHALGVREDRLEERVAARVPRRARTDSG